MKKKELDFYFFMQYLFDDAGQNVFRTTLQMNSTTSLPSVILVELKKLQPIVLTVAHSHNKIDWLCMDYLCFQQFFFTFWEVYCVIWYASMHLECFIIECFSTFYKFLCFSLTLIQVVRPSIVNVHSYCSKAHFHRSGS